MKKIVLTDSVSSLAARSLPARTPGRSGILFVLVLVAAAVVVYRRALERKIGVEFDFTG